METRLSAGENSELPTVEAAWNPYWRQVLVRCNPFYLLSSLCLVYGIYRVAIDPFFLKRDLLQLLFSFGSLEVYGVMLAGTAIWLARKSIWYDATLLVLLENMLVLMPFMLVSHAVFMQDGVAMILCVAATALAAGKFGSFKRFFPGLNLPGQSLWLGAVVLGVNVTLPLLFRRGMDADIELWAGRRDYFWMIVLPLLALMSGVLPAPREGAGSRREHEQNWIPLVSYLLWVGGTAAHVYIIDYVDEQRVSVGDLSVLIWAAGWVLVMRARDLIEPGVFMDRARPVWLALPLGATLFAFANSPEVTVTLHFMNGLIYALIAVRQHARRCALFAATSAALALLAIPEAMVTEVIKGYRKEWLAPGLAAATGLWVSLRSRTARGGLLGAICIALISGWALHRNPWGVHAVLQVSAVYLLAHSLFWAGEQERGAQLLRVITAAAWMGDCVLLQENLATARAGYLVPIAMVALALVSWLARRRESVWFGAAALMAYLAMPLYSAGVWITRAPLGVLAVLGGFALFGVGTWFALRRKPAAVG